jgi:hypothetical protein
VTNDAPKAPAGWYPTPEGGQRYWDGERWANLPAPPTAGASPAPAPRRSRKPLVIGAAVLAAVLVLGGGATVAMKVVADERAAAEQAESAAAAAAEEERAAEEEERAERVQRAIERDQRQKRGELITEVEYSITEMAREHVADGIIDGPVNSVACNPVAGGSMDDLTEKTTVFECFVGGERDSSGNTMGYYYNATVNWDTLHYTYGFGRP